MLGDWSQINSHGKIYLKTVCLQRRDRGKYNAGSSGRERGTSVVHPTSVSADPGADAGALLRLGEVHAETVARHALVADHTDGLLGAPFNHSLAHCLE